MWYSQVSGIDVVHEQLRLAAQECEHLRPDCPLALTGSRRHPCKGSAHPVVSQTRSHPGRECAHLRQDCANICARTAPTSAPGLRPHLRQDCAHICMEAGYPTVAADAVVADTMLYTGAQRHDRAVRAITMPGGTVRTSASFVSLRWPARLTTCSTLGYSCLRPCCAFGHALHITRRRGTDATRLKCGCERNGKPACPCRTSLESRTLTLSPACT